MAVMQPVSHRAIPDLVMILQADDELLQPRTARLGAALPAMVRGPLTSKEPTVLDGVGDRGRGPCIAFEVAVTIARDQAAHLVMKVVRPDSVEPSAAVLGRAQQIDVVAIVFRDEQDRSRCVRANRCA